MKPTKRDTIYKGSMKVRKVVGLVRWKVYSTKTFKKELTTHSNRKISIDSSEKEVRNQIRISLMNIMMIHLIVITYHQLEQAFSENHLIKVLSGKCIKVHLFQIFSRVQKEAGPRQLTLASKEKTWASVDYKRDSRKEMKRIVLRLTWLNQTMTFNRFLKKQIWRERNLCLLKSMKDLIRE